MQDVTRTTYLEDIATRYYQALVISSILVQNARRAPDAAATVIDVFLDTVKIYDERDPNEETKRFARCVP